MRAIPWRVQLGLVACCYGAVLTLAAALIIERYLQYARHPEEVSASSGMYAFGDLMLEMFIAGALLVPTILMVLVIAKSETAFAIYSKILLALSMSAPLSFGLLLIPSVSSGPGLLGFICLYRLEASPFALAAMGFSRIMARFPLAKRLTSYSLFIEAFSLIAVIGIFPASLVSHRH